MGDLDGSSWGSVLGGSSCYEEVDRIGKADSSARLRSTVTTADHSAGIEGEVRVLTVLCAR